MRQYLLLIALTLTQVSRTAPYSSCDRLITLPLVISSAFVATTITDDFTVSPTASLVVPSLSSRAFISSQVIVDIGLRAAFDESRDASTQSSLNNGESVWKFELRLD